MVLTRLNRSGWMRAGMMAAMLGATVSMTGCYGSFPLTRLIYTVNGQMTKSTIIHSIVMIVLIIIPVYWVAMLIDIILFNSFEYWTKEELDIGMSGELSDGTAWALVPGPAKNETTLTITRGGSVVDVQIYRRIDSTKAVVLNEEGEVIRTCYRDQNSGIAALQAGLWAPSLAAAGPQESGGGN